MNIHEELHRLVLRQRWIRWSLRNYKPGDYRRNGPKGRMQILSERLTAAKPTFWNRPENDENVDEMT